MPEPSTTPVLNALSFDIEDWFHMVEIEAVADPEKWPTLPSLVERETEWILDTLDDAGVTATFFMLGWIADRYPKLVSTIAERGHELAAHSFWHRRVDILSPEEFHEDMRQCVDAVEQASGVKVRGFRAPSFSIVPGTEWAFDVLHDLGITYDSSLFPAKRGHGGYECPQTPHTFEGAPSGTPIEELPISVMRIGPKKVPFSGGGYMRLLPARVIRKGFDQFNAAGWPVVVYLHPRDFAADCPRVPMPLHRKFKSYVGLKTTRRKLKMLLDRYRFGTCAQVLESWRGVEAS